MTIIPIEGAKGTTYQARWPDPLNAKKMKTKNFKTKDAAKSHLKNLPKTQEAEAARAEVESSPTIKETLEAWLVAAETTGIDDHPPVQGETLRHYTTEAEHFYELLLLGDDGKPDPQRRVADIRIKALTAQDSQKIRTALLHVMSRKNAKRCFSRLRFALNEAVRNGHIDTNAAKVVMITMPSRNKEPVRIPEESEVESLLRQAERNKFSNNFSIRVPWIRYELMLRLLVGTGMRPSELRGLPAKAIAVDFPIIAIMQKAEEDGMISDPKSAAGWRHIRIDSQLWEDLKVWIATERLDANDLVFGTDSGRAQSLANISNHMWYPLQKRAGLVTAAGKPKYNLYSVRHFYASQEIALGANQKELQEAMGHSSIKITLDTYGHLFKLRQGGGQQARAEERAKRLAGNRPEEKEAQVVQFKRVG